MHNMIATGGDGLYLFKTEMFEIRFCSIVCLEHVCPVQHMHLFVLIALN